MRFAYADPPYPGHSARYYADHPDYAGEVDHADLVERLEREFPDGWVLSTSAVVLPEILALCPYERGTDPKNPGRVEPERAVRTCAWIRPDAQPKPVAIGFGWEPVIVRGGRLARYQRTLDYLIAPAANNGHDAFTGAKPPAFCRWIFDLLGAETDDELVDLFPGSGAVAREWERFQAQPELLRPELVDAEPMRMDMGADVTFRAPRSRTP